MPPSPPAPPAIDVVIPLHEGAPWIEGTLATVRAQEHAPREIVVVDDRSTDDGPARAARVPGVRLLRSAGPRRTRHTGLLATSSPFVAFLDQDDVWHPSHLSLLAEALARHPEAPAVTATWRYFHEGQDPRLAPDGGRRAWLDPWRLWPLACPIPTPSSVLFRRDALAAVGGWQLDALPDWELYLRLADPARVLQVPAQTCGYRLHARAHSTALRSDGLAYLDRHRRSADAALAERLARGASPALRARLARRRRVLEDLAPVLRAARGDGDPAAAADGARALEADLAPESRLYAEAAFAACVHLLCPGDEPGRFLACGDRLLADLDLRWPPDARRTKALLRRVRWRRVFDRRRFAVAILRGRLSSARRQWRARREGLAVQDGRGAEVRRSS